MPLSTDRLRHASRLILALLFVAAGAAHFALKPYFVDIVPPALPAPEVLVVVSGVFEILGGLGVLLPRTQRGAGIGLALLLLAVLPANVYMALSPEEIGWLTAPAWVLWLRLPLQFVLIAWVLWATPRPMATGAE